MSPQDQVLRFFQKPTRATKRVVGQMLMMPDEALIEVLIQRNRMPLTEQDQDLLEAAKQQARERIERGAHHTFCYVLGESGNLYAGIQETYRRAGDLETCAEVGAISNLDIAREKPKTAVTVHFMPIPERDGKGVTTVVPPCLSCAGRFRHLHLRHHHDFGIIVYHSREVIKVSVKVVHLFQYPHGYNGDGTSQF